MCQNGEIARAMCARMIDNRYGDNDAMSAVVTVAGGKIRRTGKAKITHNKCVCVLISENGNSLFYNKAISDIIKQHFCNSWFFSIFNSTHSDLVALGTTTKRKKDINTKQIEKNESHNSVYSFEPFFIL